MVFASYLAGFLPKIEKFLPTRLTDGVSLIYGVAEGKDYTTALVITAVASLLCIVASILAFHKKHL